MLHVYIGDLSQKICNFIQYNIVPDIPSEVAKNAEPHILTVVHFRGHKSLHISIKTG